MEAVDVGQSRASGRSCRIDHLEGEDQTRVGDAQNSTGRSRKVVVT